MIPRGVTVVSEQTRPPAHSWGEETSSRRLFLHSAHIDVTVRLHLLSFAVAVLTVLVFCTGRGIDQQVDRSVSRSESVHRFPGISGSSARQQDLVNTFLQSTYTVVYRSMVPQLLLTGKLPVWKGFGWVLSWNAEKLISSVSLSLLASCALMLDAMVSLLRFLFYGYH